jgi:hypothetical protein
MLCTQRCSTPRSATGLLAFRRPTHPYRLPLPPPPPPPPQYDKFHLRGCIDALLMELWRDPTCGASLTAVAQAAAGAPDGGLFADFVGAVLNDLLYLLKDSLQVGGRVFGGSNRGTLLLQAGAALAARCTAWDCTPTLATSPSFLLLTQRLEDIHALEVSKADRQRWEAVPQREREEKQVGAGTGGCLAGTRVGVACRLHSGARQQSQPCARCNPPPPVLPGLLREPAGHHPRFHAHGCVHAGHAQHPGGERGGADGVHSGDGGGARGGGGEAPLHTAPHCPLAAAAAPPCPAAVGRSAGAPALARAVVPRNAGCGLALVRRPTPFQCVGLLSSLPGRRRYTLWRCWWGRAALSWRCGTPPSTTSTQTPSSSPWSPSWPAWRSSQRLCGRCRR